VPPVDRIAFDLRAAALVSVAVEGADREALAVRAEDRAEGAAAEVAPE